MAKHNQSDSTSGLVENYLDIAERVLRATKRPMTARGIIEVAYRSKIMPPKLYGRTQHKTLQARLSEDILRRRNFSKFFRTEPGTFFLAEFVSDPEIPDHFKEAFSARRRTRDFTREPCLGIAVEFLENALFGAEMTWTDLAKKAEKEGAIQFVDHREGEEKYAIAWAYSIVRRSNLTLSYRIGRYRDDRDEFANRRTIGFPCVIGPSNQTLFSPNDYGALDAGLNAVSLDLDIHRPILSGSDILDVMAPTAVRFVKEENKTPALLLIMQWKCPDWYEPTTRRLSLNELTWMDTRVKPNNLEDFEVWSCSAMSAIFPWWST